MRAGSVVDFDHSDPKVHTEETPNDSSDNGGQGGFVFLAAREPGVAFVGRRQRNPEMKGVSLFHGALVSVSLARVWNPKQTARAGSMKMPSV